jgi:hypothetical protein
VAFGFIFALGIPPVNAGNTPYPLAVVWPKLMGASPMTPTKSEQFNALSDFLGTQREAILQAWWIAADSDPRQTTVRAGTGRRAS